MTGTDDRELLETAVYDLKGYSLLLSSVVAYLDDVGEPTDADVKLSAFDAIQRGIEAACRKIELAAR